MRINLVKYGDKNMFEKLGYGSRFPGVNDTGEEVFSFVNCLLIRIVKQKYPCVDLQVLCMCIGLFKNDQI
jgi:hypothetical protein